MPESNVFYVGPRSGKKIRTLDGSDMRPCPKVGSSLPTTVLDKHQIIGELLFSLRPMLHCIFKWNITYFYSYKYRKIKCFLMLTMSGIGVAIFYYYLEIYKVSTFNLTPFFLNTSQNNIYFYFSLIPSISYGTSSEQKTVSLNLVFKIP